MDNGMNKKAAGDAYADLLNQVKGTKEGQEALGRVSPGEIGWGVAGAAGGGALGYLMSRLVHRKASARTKMLYTLLGALAGGGGSQYLLANMKGSKGFDGTKRDEMRLSGLSAMPTVNTEDVKTDSKGNPVHNSSSTLFNPHTTALLVATIGGVRGYRGQPVVDSKKSTYSIWKLNPDLYGTVHSLRHGTTEANTQQLRDLMKNRPIDFQSGAYTNLSRYKNRWIIKHNGVDPNTLTLEEDVNNRTRKRVNAGAGAVEGALAGYLLHGGGRWLARKYGMSDPERAYVTKEDILKAAEQMRRNS